MMKKLLAGLALAVVTMLAVPQQAGAVSLLSPASVAGTQKVSNGTVTEVRWGGHRGGFGRGHFRGHRGFRVHRGWRGRHFGWRPRYFAPRYYGYGPVRRCRVVWTYYGPQRVCRFRGWY